MKNPDFESCQVVVETPIAWGEMDAYQHVNNAMYFRYFETARIAYFERVGVNDFKEKQGIGPILASTKCRFKAPLTYPDTISIATSVTELAQDRFTMKYFIISHQSGRIAAEGEGLIVYYDYNHNSKHDIPDPIRAQIIALDSLDSETD